MIQFHDQLQVLHNNHYSSLISQTLNDPYHGINLPRAGTQEAEAVCKFYAAFILYEEKLPTTAITMHDVSAINGIYAIDLGLFINQEGYELAIALSKNESLKHK